MATSPAPSTVITAVEPSDLDARACEFPLEADCDVCSHAMAGHDAIAQRFCRATQARVLSRACLCRAKDAPPS